MAQDMIDRLAKVPLFSGCSKKELKSVARSAKVIKHPAGTVIATEGDPGRGLFIIADGDRHRDDPGYGLCAVAVGLPRHPRGSAGDRDANARSDGRPSSRGGDGR